MNIPLQNFIQHYYQHEHSGHDWFHIARVTALAIKLCEPNDDQKYVQKLALLHEAFDDKLEQTLDLQKLLANGYLTNDEVAQLQVDIHTIGYKGGFAQPTRSRAAQIVSDADLLDAMGAIGIARTFQYNGHVKHAPFFDPELALIAINNYEEYRQKERNAIAHFEEKLLRLKSLIVTTKGKELAIIRHQRLVNFVNDFFEELAEAGVDTTHRFYPENS